MAGGNTPSPFGFTGELHAEGLVYLRARWYDPSSGAFTARDPFAGFPTMPYSLHPYQYGYSNPVLWTDPSGRCASPGDPNCDLEGFDGWIDNPDDPAQALDDVQAALDAGGLAPFIGEPLDGINGVIYLLRGKYVDAALSCGAMVPFAGILATIGKSARRVDKIAGVSAATSRVFPSGRTLARYADADHEALLRFNEAANATGGSIRFNWANEILDPNQTVYVIKNAEGEIQGAMSWRRVTFSGEEGIHVINLQSITKKSNPGAGQELLQAIAEQAADEGLGIYGTAGNKKLVKYYESLGATEVLPETFWVKPEDVQELARKFRD